jgi:hypothetical protein
MPGQLCWLSTSTSEGQLMLHLRERSFDPWVIYTLNPHYKVPDSVIPTDSKGWSTCQKLMQAGWILIPTIQTPDTFVKPEAQWVSNY